MRVLRQFWDVLVGLASVLALGLLLSSCQAVDLNDGLLSRELGVFQPGSNNSREYARTTIKLRQQQIDPVEIAPMAAELEALGFDRPTFYTLTPEYSAGEGSFDLFVPAMTFIVFREGGWEPNAVMQTVTDLPVRYADCEIGISDILVIETSLTPAGQAAAQGLNFDVLQVDNYNRITPLMRRLPTQRRPLFFFVGSIFSEQYQESVGGFAAHVITEFDGALAPQSVPQSPIAFTGAVARRPMSSQANYQYDQTISHEVGHLLGLPHVRGQADQNIMGPITCRDCGFTPGQCAVMRRGSLLTSSP